MAAIPQLKTSIAISPYDQAASLEAKPRFLLEIDDRHFLVSGATRALVLALLSRPTSLEELEQRYQTESGQFIAASELLELASKNLPAALFHDAPEKARSMPFTVSVTLLPSKLASKITACFAWLFTPILAKILVPLFVLLHIAVLPSAMQAAHSGWSGTTSVQLICLLLLSGLLHELGHTSACRYFGCPHGGIGFGLYFIFPAWYADVSKAWRLSRKQRAVVDLGGVYFQAILLIAIDGYALLNGFEQSEFALKLIWLITFTMLFTLNPVFKFDGYWLLSDLSGIHNLHQQVQKSSAEFFGALFARRKINLRQQWVLHSYALLSIVYFSYFALFLVREVSSIFNKLPQTLSHGGQALQVASSAKDATEIGMSLLRLSGDLLWPLVIFSACFFFLDKLRRALLEVNSAIFSARTAMK